MGKCKVPLALFSKTKTCLGSDPEGSTVLKCPQAWVAWTEGGKARHRTWEVGSLCPFLQYGIAWGPKVKKTLLENKFC